MQYLNHFTWHRSLVNNWQELDKHHQLTAVWAAITLGVVVVFVFSQKILPESPIVFRYFLALYTVDSALFFLIFRQYSVLGKTLLFFLASLQVVTVVYYLLNYLSAGSL